VGLMRIGIVYKSRVELYYTVEIICQCDRIQMGTC
jgi:hypothetical protein